MTTDNNSGGSRRYRILGVDDSSTQRKVLSLSFAPPHYELTLAENGAEGIKLLKAKPGYFDVVLSDIEMPDMDGFAFCKEIRETLGLHHLPVLIVSSNISAAYIKKALASGADEFVVKPFNKTELTERIDVAAEQKRMMDGLDEAELVLFALARLVEAKDTLSGHHCDRLVHTLRVFARTLDLNETETKTLAHAGILHDIGKLAIPDTILMKPGSLTDEERKSIQRHTTVGAILIGNHKGLEPVVDIVRHHHERFNGSGYPDGLKGDEIPYLARVFQIADLYDALSNDRVYNTGYDRDKVIKIMVSETKKDYWDRELMQTFLTIASKEAHRLEKSAEARVPMSIEKINRIIDSSAARKKRTTAVKSDERR